MSEVVRRQADAILFDLFVIFDRFMRDIPNPQQRKMWSVYSAQFSLALVPQPAHYCSRPGGTPFLGFSSNCSDRTNPYAVALCGVVDAFHATGTRFLS